MGPLGTRAPPGVGESVSFLLSVGLPFVAGIEKGITHLSTAFTQNIQIWVVKSQELNIKKELDNRKSYFYNYSLNTTNGVFQDYTNLYLGRSRPLFFFEIVVCRLLSPMLNIVLLAKRKKIKMICFGRKKERAKPVLLGRADRQLGIQKTLF